MFGPRSLCWDELGREEGTSLVPYLKCMFGFGVFFWIVVVILCSFGKDGKDLFRGSFNYRKIIKSITI